MRSSRRGAGGKSRGKTLTKLVITEKQTLRTPVPPDSRFKGCETYVVQDRVLGARVIRFRRERWLTPEGKTYLAPLPPGVTGHFGPELRRFVLPSPTRAK